ncbi:hypothetical protein [Hyphomicrobium sp.]|uniref:hypothetical protein n=1 Tax=Hyphomicrobium sp. TaxID=82 RepID=UPI002E3605FA|nr:hypothetical protein [Hyphomicrobium sp.]HEX2843223.1 hypothetical protein [Hyphomicrobium sp.]
MPQITAKRIFAVALVPLLLLGSLRPSAEAEVGARAANAETSHLQLASLKAEARSLAVHIDGP